MLIPSAWYAWQWRSMPHVSEYQDDGLYFVGAKSLAQTGQYKIESLAGRPAQTKYPPLWPAVLSLAWLAAPQYPQNLPWAMLLCWVFLPLSLWMYRSWLIRAGFGVNVAVFLGALWALNPYVELFSTTMLSELPFIFLLLASLCLLRDDGPKWAAAAGAVAALAFLTRTAGIALLPAGIGFYLLRKRWKEAAVFSALMLPAIFGWMGWSAANRWPDRDPVVLVYTDYFGYYLVDVVWKDFYLYLWKNVDGILHGLGAVLLPDITVSLLDKVLAESLALAGIVGVVREVGSDRKSALTPYAIFAVAFAGLLSIWNFQPTERLVLPLVPLWFVGLFLEMKRLKENIASVFARKDLSQKIAGGIMAGVVGLILVYAGSRQWQLLTEGLPEFYEKHQIALRDTEPAMAWIRANLPAEARILSANDPLLYLRTGRQGIAPFVSNIHWYREDDAGMIASLSQSAAQAQRLHMEYFVLNDGDLSRDTPPAVYKAVTEIIRNDPRFEKIYQAGPSTIYRVLPTKN